MTKEEKMRKVRDEMKKIIDEEGTEYITKKPYEVYQKLIKGKADKALSRLVLVTFLADAAGEAKKGSAAEEFSSMLSKECLLKKAAADNIAGMYIDLLSEKNMKAWEDKKECGLDELCNSVWTYTWYGEAQWNISRGYIDCSCEVSATLSVENRDLVHNTVQKLLEDNPYTPAKVLFRYISDRIDKELDDDLKEYVTADNYYEPYMDDYDCEDVLVKCCKKMGMKVTDFECTPDSSDYIPNNRW